ncbi:unnamed protein product [Adineta ricciae]|uniref:Uncharacterized protein n=1 Tax=Adineta ricciae TaxID=249248 RepID=A0A815KCP0_ADIRI|nr:unnamed protein product [Adineta ricciae]
MKHFNFLFKPIANDDEVRTLYDTLFGLPVTEGENEGDDGCEDDFDRPDITDNLPADDFLNDLIFQRHTNESQMELEIANYVCQANLDKTKTNRLLTLLMHIHDQEMPPPASCAGLWNRLDIKFKSSCCCNNVHKQIPSELIVFSVADEITRVIRNNYYAMSRYKLKGDGTRHDIVHGEIYKRQSNQSPNPITLLLSCDGKPTLKSSKSSLWPVLISIVEIPRPFRDNEQNMILLRLWHSCRSPTATQLLDRITKDLSYLIKTRLDVEINDAGRIHFDIFVQDVCADGPGQSKATQMVSHNGYFACRVCEIEGNYYAADKTSTYPWSLFHDTDPYFRTRHRFALCLQEVHRLRAIDSKNINVRGIKDVSSLNQLIFIPTQAIYDYFHLCLKGHMKALLKEWNDMHRGASTQTREIIHQFDIFLSDVSYPHTIHRRVLALPFLLYFRRYFPPLLDFHFSLYAIYIRTLCHFDEHKQVYDVRRFIENHLRRFSEFYRNSKELLSTHCSVHLWQQVIRHGSLSSTRSSASRRIVASTISSQRVVLPAASSQRSLSPSPLSQRIPSPSPLHQRVLLSNPPAERVVSPSTSSQRFITPSASSQRFVTSSVSSQRVAPSNASSKYHRSFRQSADVEDQFLSFNEP